MADTQIPSSSGLSDQQFIQVSGPDGIVAGYQYDKQTKTLFAKESELLFPRRHGSTHISQDPIPVASCDSPGLMSANDKCKVDSLLQTRLGVLGFLGSGFPDDGGWMNGDIILAAGTDFISLERVGNVIRFTIDAPIPLNCSCESCTQIFWVQDETSVADIRPPTCNGKLPGINGYGELKIYQFPESTFVNSTSPSTTLNLKGNYPGLFFTRYEDGLLPNQAQFELILQRNSTNSSVTEVGWAMTPGATGVAECVWFMGADDDLNPIRFELAPDAEPGALGALLYKGHLLTKQMGVITDYGETILDTNQYVCKLWDVDNHQVVGDSFTATNVWLYDNPENPESGSDPRTLRLDSSLSILPVGTLVDLWWFEISATSRRYYFSKRPPLDADSVWTTLGSVQFGDTLVARVETSVGAGSTDRDEADTVDDIRTFEDRVWGLTGLDVPVLTADSDIDTDSDRLNVEDIATLDTSLPGLTISLPSNPTSTFNARPVMLWNRTAHNGSLIVADIGRSDVAEFPPYDFLLRAPIDSYEPIFMRVEAVTTISGLNAIRVKGVHFHDLPRRGAVRLLNGGQVFAVWRYSNKFIFPSADQDCVVLAGKTADNTAFPGLAGDVIELLHADYTAPCVRLEMGEDGSGEHSLQVKVGTLSMAESYEENDSDESDDLVRGLEPGYAVGPILTQEDTFSGVGEQPDTNLSGFVLYDGGLADDSNEYWNRLEILERDGKVWIWWNELLISPSTVLSAALDTPVSINTPYFTIDTATEQQSGKVGVRLWPGAKLRRMSVATRARSFSEYSYGQIQL